MQALAKTIVGTNVPKDILEFPLTGTEKSSKARPEIDKTQYVAPEIVFTSMPQPEMPEPEDVFLGVPDGITQSLFYVRMYELAMLVNIGAHLGILGVPMPESEITETVAPYLDAFFVEKAVNQLYNSRHGKHETKKSTVVRDRLGELLVRISPPKEPKYKEGKNAPETPLKVSKRGRTGEGRPKRDRLVYLPTEGEWDQVFLELIAIHTFTPEERGGKGVEKTLGRLADIRGSDDFSKYLPKKSLDLLKSKERFVAFFCAGPVFEANGSRAEFSAWEIAKQGAVCPKTAKKYLEVIDVRVFPNPVVRTLLKEEDYQFLPADLSERDARKKLKLLPPSIHLQNGDGRQTAYTLFGLDALLADKDGSKDIYACFFPMSTYDGSHSPFNPYHADTEASRPETTQAADITFRYSHEIQTGDVEYTQETVTETLSPIGDISPANEFAPILDEYGLRQVY